MMDMSAELSLFLQPFIDRFGHRKRTGLVDQSQKMTVAARAMAERKAIRHLS